MLPLSKISTSVDAYSFSSSCIDHRGPLCFEGYFGSRTAFCLQRLIQLLSYRVWPSRRLTCCLLDAHFVLFIDQFDFMTCAKLEITREKNKEAWRWIKLKAHTWPRMLFICKQLLLNASNAYMYMYEASHWKSAQSLWQRPISYTHRNVYVVSVCASSGHCSWNGICVHANARAKFALHRNFKEWTRLLDSQLF